ncbi:hypothetical protein FSP39_022290 [Pinctada imbricata]|uniref:Arginine kinase n=1 Tax=Pinctada imbricata TaxID=66713 RepID=A0AA88YCF5_PINIB|nr:hypothetical protein FSP39_022290 [Pinctada imbricata]
MTQPLCELWKKLHEATDCSSLLKKYLTPECYDKLKDRKTSLGGTLADCIQSGCLNLKSNVGIYACDPEGYEVFADVLDPVIKDYHKVSEINHPAPDFGDLDNLGFGDLDPEGNFIVSTRVRVGRSHAKFAFPPVATLEHREEMEKACKEALEQLDGELKGTYHPLTGMPADVNQQLINDHFMFKNDDKCLNDALGYKDWPTGRGIFFNPKKNFLVWVNEEDHLRIISMQQGGNLAEVYKRLVTAIKTLETKNLQFAHSPRLGYLTFCPTNLGTTMRASVHIKIPKLSKSPEFNAFCDQYHLQARGIHGEHTESVGGVYDISNKRRLGLTEFQAVTEMANGIREMIKKEKSL